MRPTTGLAWRCRGLPAARWFCALSVVMVLLVLSAVFHPTAALDNATFDCRNVTEIPESECRALVALYQSTNGPAWRGNTNWLTTEPVSSWSGVLVWHGHVAALFLYGKRLDGYLPAELTDLRDLAGLRLEFNRLRGPVPLQLGFLPHLQTLTLNNNLFSGPLPQSLVALRLDWFTFSHTDLCEPANLEFQTWLRKIPSLSRTGVLCAAASTPSPTPTCTTSVAPSPYILRVNAGGTTYTDTTGLVWQADRSYAYCTPPYWGATGGQVYATTQPIASTDDDALYQSERYFAGPAGYRFRVPNGQYQITLRFAEIYPYAYVGSRVFDVRAEGQVIASGLDVLARSGGLDRAYDITVVVSVNDGELNLDFVPLPGHNAPFVNAIAVTQFADVAPAATPMADE